MTDQIQFADQFTKEVAVLTADLLKQNAELDVISLYAWFLDFAMIYKIDESARRNFVKIIAGMAYGDYLRTEGIIVDLGSEDAELSLRRILKKVKDDRNG